MIDTKKLEKLLIKSWTEFIDIHEMMHYTTKLATELGFVTQKVKKVSITRFELVENGFLVWVDYIVVSKNKDVNISSEIFLNSNDIKHLKSIILNDFK
jgi:hypothetical protein